jgi:hypothetical protein
LFLIPLLLIPGNINLIGVDDGGNMVTAIDVPPVLSFSSNTIHTTTTAIITIVDNKNHNLIFDIFVILNIFVIY